jgi:hypothetical protein
MVEMKLSEITSTATKLFAKSEFGPASDRWPALSFSKHKIATDFAIEYRRGRDFVVYVGTSDPDKTELPEHRQNLLSILSVEPRAPISTRDLVPADVWENAVRRWGRRWEWSLPILKTYDVVGFPSARDKIPQTYRSLGGLQNLGRCVEVKTESEYQTLLGLDINEIRLHLSRRAQEILHLNTDDRVLRQELSRLANGIIHDIAASGTPRSGSNPLRLGPNLSDVFRILMNRWNEQDGLCALCDRPIPLTTANKLLQMSRDRTESTNRAYDWENTRLTHLACNLGKRDASLDDWREYLALIRQG